MQKPILLFGSRAAIGELAKSMVAGDMRLSAGTPSPQPVILLTKARPEPAMERKGAADEPASKADGGDDPIDRHHKQAAADFGGWAEHPDLPDHVKQAAAERRDQLVAARTPEQKRKALMAAHKELAGMHQDEDVPNHLGKDMHSRMQAIHGALH